MIDFMRAIIVVVFWAVLMLESRVMAEDEKKVLVDFTSDRAAEQWQTVNDGVMGGLSQGRFKITPPKQLEFFGVLSLENNGGFASVRSKPKKLGLRQGDILIPKIKGDGREYSLNLYVSQPRVAFSYRAKLVTKKDEWLEPRIPLADFVATSFGRPLPEAGPVPAREITGVGFLLGDKKAGAFSLMVDSIQIIRKEE